MLPAAFLASGAMVVQGMELGPVWGWAVMVAAFCFLGAYLFLVLHAEKTGTWDEEGLQR